MRRYVPRYQVSVPKQPEFAARRDPRPVSSHIARFRPSGLPAKAATRFVSMAHRACKNRYNGPSTRRQHAQHAGESRKSGTSPAMSRAPDHGELLNHSIDPGHAVGARSYVGRLPGPASGAAPPGPAPWRQARRSHSAQSDNPPGVHRATHRRRDAASAPKPATTLRTSGPKEWAQRARPAPALRHRPLSGLV